MGSAFEQLFAQELFDKGFWVLNVPSDKAGQPADIVAVRNGKAYLIDCKVVSSKTFPLSRVEFNQHCSMQLWEQCGNGIGLFAFSINNQIYIMDYQTLFKVTKKSLTINDIREMSITLEEWNDSSGI